MNQLFYTGNRNRLYKEMKVGSILILFSGNLIHKSADDYYPFYTDRNFMYLTGLEEQGLIFMACKLEESSVREIMYIHKPNPMVERMKGIHIKQEQVNQSSGINEIKYLSEFDEDLNNLIHSDKYKNIYMDFHTKKDCSDKSKPMFHYSEIIREEYPFVSIMNLNPVIRQMRTIKQECEIAAIREAERITRDGIVSMMKASKDGMYEYQYKAEFDYAIGQYGPHGAAWAPIISAGKNNFCIHYYEYTGRAKAGDLILCDVGAWHDGLMADVSRGFPCNGRFTERQRVLYDCALNTSNHMFEIIKPGMRMEDVDLTIRKYNCEQLKKAGVIKDDNEIGTYMWHGGAHHLGWDVHDEVERPEVIAPGMVFCVDVGIYHEEWGIGFRIEDNCLVTENGCENLSVNIPRTPEEIEAVMNG